MYPDIFFLSKLNSEYNYFIFHVNKCNKIKSQHQKYIKTKKINYIAVIKKSNVT